MKSVSKWLFSAVALAALASTTVPASAQRFGYGDDGPPPFRHGPGWEGRRHWGPWDRWHHQRRWGEEGSYRRGWRDEGGRGWRDEGRGGGRGRFGQDDGRGAEQRQFRRDDGRRLPGGDDGPRRGGPGRGGPGAFGGSDD